MLNFLRGDKSNEGVGSTKLPGPRARPRRHRLLRRGARRRAQPAVRRRRQPGLQGIRVGARSDAHADGLRRRQRRHAARVRRFDASAADAGKETWAYVPKVLFSGGDPNDYGTTRRTRRFSSARSATGVACIPQFAAQVLRQRDAARLGHRFRQHQHQHAAARPATIGARCWSAGSARAVAPSMRSTSPTPVALHGHRSRHRDRRVACCGSSPTPNLGYVFDAPTLVKTQRLRLGRAGRVRLQQSGRQGLPLRPQSEDGQRSAPEDFATGDSGTDADPSGLSTIRAFTASRKDPVRAAGLRRRSQGQRLALRPFRSPIRPNWKVELIAKLTDAQRQRRSRSRPASASRSTRTTTSTATCSSAPASCSVTNDIESTTPITRHQHALRDPGRHPDRGRGRHRRRPIRAPTSIAVNGTSVAGFSGTRDRPRLVSGRDRPDAEDRHRRLRGRADRRLRVLQADAPTRAAAP